MDPHEPVRDGSLSFVSHAHSDHTGNHTEVVFTEPTRRLMRARVAGRRTEHVLDYGVRTDSAQMGRPAGLFSLQLAPAGHVLGSAMALLEAEGRTLLYTGDFKLRQGLSAEPCVPLTADVLVMETTFGRPHYRFPPAEEVFAAVLRFCRDALDNDEVPVLLGYSLGKSQEILCALAHAGLPVMLHDSVAAMTRIYADLGCLFPLWSPWDPDLAEGHVLIVPPGKPAQSLRERLPWMRTASLTGWALDSGTRFRPGTDASFPLSDHADFPDLVEMVRRVGPKRVFTLHGFAAEFAAHLRHLGFDAVALSETDQLELLLSTGNPVLPNPATNPSASLPRPQVAEGLEAKEPVDADNSFRGFARTCEAIRQESSKDSKVRSLACHFRDASVEDLPALARWFSGRVYPAGFRAIPEMAIGPLSEALCTATGCTRSDLRTAYQTHCDLPEAAAMLASRSGKSASQPPSLGEVQRILDRLAPHHGEDAKARATQLVPLMQKCSPGELRFLLRLLAGQLRIGLSDTRVEAALAQALGTDPEAIRRGHLCLGDLGETARTARDGGLDTVTVIPFRPLNATRLESHRSSPEAQPPASRGIPMQLHRVGPRVELYSTASERLTDRHPGLVEAAGLWNHHVILEGILLSGTPGSPRKRSAGRRDRKTGSLDLFSQEIPGIQFVVRDLFWNEGVPWIQHSAAERHRELESLDRPPTFVLG